MRALHGLGARVVVEALQRVLSDPLMQRLHVEHVCELAEHHQLVRAAHVRRAQVDPVQQPLDLHCAHLVQGDDPHPRLIERATLLEAPGQHLPQHRAHRRQHAHVRTQLSLARRQVSSVAVGPLRDTDRHVQQLPARVQVAECLPAAADRQLLRGRHLPRRRAWTRTARLPITVPPHPRGPCAHGPRPAHVRGRAPACCARTDNSRTTRRCSARHPPSLHSLHRPSLLPIRLPAVVTTLVQNVQKGRAKIQEQAPGLRVGWLGLDPHARSTTRRVG